MTINHASFAASSHLEGAGNEVTAAIVRVSWRTYIFNLVTVGPVARREKPRIRYSFANQLARIP
jgi:hypothetical protein